MTIISTVTRMTDDVNGKFGTKLAQESAETTFSFRRWKLPPAVKVKQTRHSRRKKRQTRQLLPILSTFLSLFLFSFFFLSLSQSQPSQKLRSRRAAAQHFPRGDYNTTFLFLCSHAKMHYISAHARSFFPIEVVCDDQ